VLTESQALATEEGLATINTMLNSRSKLLGSAALSYVSVWLASTMGFTELFEALRPLIPSVGQRWAQVYRAKRGLEDTSLPGGLTKDQAYFDGAWRILERRHELQFALIHSALISIEEHNDALTAWLKYQAKIPKRPRLFVPAFLDNMELYHKTLDEIASANGIAAQTGAVPRLLSFSEMSQLVSRRKMPSKNRKGCWNTSTRELSVAEALVEAQCHHDRIMECTRSDSSDGAILKKGAG
jgi:hypothetical protein